MYLPEAKVNAFKTQRMRHFHCLLLVHTRPRLSFYITYQLPLLPSTLAWDLIYARFNFHQLS